MVVRARSCHKVDIVYWPGAFNGLGTHGCGVTSRRHLTPRRSLRALRGRRPGRAVEGGYSQLHEPGFKPCTTYAQRHARPPRAALGYLTHAKHSTDYSLPSRFDAGVTGSSSTSRDARRSAIRRLADPDRHCGVCPNATVPPVPPSGLHQKPI